MLGHNDVLLLKLLAVSKLLQFPPQSENYLGINTSKVSDEIKKLTNTLIISNNSSDVMMKSFITEEGSRSIHHYRYPPF